MNCTSTVALVLPGLFEPPDGALEQIRTGGLHMLLSRARRQTIAQIHYEAVLGALFNSADSATGYLPVAAIERSADNERNAATEYLRADPVHLQIDRDYARLRQGDALALTPGESNELVTAINQQFRDDGILVEMEDAYRWYLRAERTLDVDMQPPAYAAGRNVDHFMPTGASSGQWKAFLTEVQMVLHAHPVNQARVSQRQLPINSLWLWGGGALPQNVDSGIETLCTSDSLPKALAGHLAIQHRDIDQFSACLENNTRTLLVDESLYQPAIQGQPAQWISALEQLEKRCFQPLLTALKRGRYQGITIDPCNGERLEITRADLRKFWKRRKPVAEYFPRDKSNDMLQ